ncbi:Arc family DNA binding domain-containing protein [Olsenella sp. An290]|uniref:Arc family DNA binding domain-containing protein n=1 Tax=Olsenella sp. An290 TaxID=1965625 RepID=UPI000B39E714|nr:Arc family DNA binding domain-containing protein [Olsenella sp. An290]OUO34503.1 Arc family DNA binding domain-containing protein [Olsenella sp. An290]
MAARKQYPLRIDPEVWAAVERWAADEMRSANAQVEWILRDALRRAGRSPKKAEKNDEQ